MYELAQTNPRFTELTEQEAFTIDGGSPKFIIVVLPPAQKGITAAGVAVGAIATAGASTVSNLVNRALDWLFGR